MTKTVAIVGFAESSRAYAPWDDTTVEIWCQNAAYRPGFVKRADRWFELHNRALVETKIEVRRPADYLDWLRNFDGPVYMQSAHADIPNSVAYPYQPVIDLVGPYLTSTVAYMIALAILEGFEQIQLYGIDMEYEEYAGQKAGCEYLLGFARGRGIEIGLPENCPLLVAPLYGLGNMRPEGEHITDDQYATRLQKLAATKEQLETQIVTLQKHLLLIEGASQETTFWINATPEGASPVHPLPARSGAKELIA